MASPPTEEMCVLPLRESVSRGEGDDNDGNDDDGGDSDDGAMRSSQRRATPASVIRLWFRLRMVIPPAP